MIRFFIKIYIVLLFVDFLLLFLPDLRKYLIFRKISEMAQMGVRPFRSLCHRHFPILRTYSIDWSPLLLIVALQLLLLLW